MADQAKAEQSREGRWEVEQILEMLREVQDGLVPVLVTLFELVRKLEQEGGEEK